MFVTILLAIVDIETGRINFASAGHNPILHYVNREHEARFLNAPGMPVGIKAGNGDFAKAMQSADIILEENDFILIYTDGVTEGRGAHRRAYGTERIVELLNEDPDRSAGDLAHAIESDINRYMGKEVQHDDITMVILKYCPGPRGEADEADSESETSDVKDTSKPSIDSVTIQTDSRPDRPS